MFATVKTSKECMYMYMYMYIYIYMYIYMYMYIYIQSCFVILLVKDNTTNLNSH